MKFILNLFNVFLEIRFFILIVLRGYFWVRVVFCEEFSGVRIFEWES